MTSYKIISDYLPEHIRRAVMKAAESQRENVTEIRLRSGRAVSFIYPDRIKFLKINGSLTDNPYNPDCVKSSVGDIADIVNSMSHYSLHSCSRELKQGFFTLENGIRAGIAGTYSDTAERIIRDFNAVNFRIARNIKGCAEEIFRKFRNTESGILICGGVNSGKTTVLRDLCRLFGNTYKVVLIDERNEISASCQGDILNDVGILTDVLSGCSRPEGIVSAVRSLSPEYIFCDEISTPEDKSAILNGIGCGVRFVSTIHAENFSGLLKRPVFREIIPAFGYGVFLEGSSMPSKIREIRRLTDDC